MLTLLVLPFTSFCQDKFVKPDYKKIEKEIADKKSKFYYPPLLERFQKNDSSLSVEEYSYLYYGYFFNKNYSSLGMIGDDKLNDEIKNLERNGASNEDIARLVKLYEQRLSSGNPFDLETLVSLYGAYDHLKNETGKRHYDLKLQGITNAIMATGDGKTEATAMHILSVSDEYAMVSILGYKSTGTQSLTQHTCDYLEIANNDDGLKGIYFDVNQIFEGYKKMFK
jgi:hypothetical protein